MPTYVEYIRSNFVNMETILTNWTYNTSDDFRIKFIQKAYQGDWPAILGFPTNLSKLWINYNLWGGRSVINFRYNGTYSGDNAVYYSAPSNYTDMYELRMNGNKIIMKNLTTNAIVMNTTIGTDTNTDIGNLHFLPHYQNEQYYFDMMFYGLEVYRDGELIHNYLPCLEGIYDKVDGTLFTLPSGVTYGPVRQMEYTIHYNANGGSGTMANQVVEEGETVALSRCTFEREDYIFIGWSTTRRGDVVYQNETFVTDLAPAGSTITLYAKWEFVKLELELSYNKSDERQIFKNLLDKEKLIGTLREESSLINPVIMVESNKIIRFNFCYIPRFQRYYFIRNIESYRKNLWVLTLECDVLMSFKNDISQCQVVVDKQTMRANGDEYIDDNSLVCDNYMYNTVYNFDGVGFNESPTYILITAG